jgi:hypothetical protein
MEMASSRWSSSAVVVQAALAVDGLGKHGGVRKRDDANSAVLC